MFLSFFLCVQKTGKLIVVNPTNDAEKDKDMVQHLLGENMYLGLSITFALPAFKKTWTKRVLGESVVHEDFWFLVLHEAAYEYWYRGGGRLFKTQMPKNFSDWVMIIEDSCDKCFKIQSRISSLDQHAQNVDNILVYFFFKSLDTWVLFFAHSKSQTSVCVYAWEIGTLGPK